MATYEDLIIEMKETLNDLIEWDVFMGSSEAKVWSRARRLRDYLSRNQDDLTIVRRHRVRNVHRSINRERLQEILHEIADEASHTKGSDTTGRDYRIIVGSNMDRIIALASEATELLGDDA